MEAEPDPLPGTTQIDYNFQDAYGLDPAGNILTNTITEPQKQRAREVFEYYSTYLAWISAKLPPLVLRSSRVTFAP